MSGEDRKSDLAREHKERQEKRAAAEGSSKAKRNAFIGAGVAVVVVAGGIFAATTLSGGDGTDPAAAESSASASASASPSASLPIAPTKTAAAGPVTCTYKRDDSVPNKFVGLPGKKPNMKLKKMTINFNRGKVVVDLMTDAAPCTVNSLSFLSKKHFYDNMKCHRLVTPDVAGVHLLQCGDPQAKADGKNPTDGQGTSGYVYADENVEIPPAKGVVFMSQPGDAMGQNNSQFVFSLSDENTQLGAGFSTVGVVSEGLDMLVGLAKDGQDLIVNEADITGDGGTTAPKKPVIIKNITFS
ncbi:Cyclophilin type peptidyl-prolyl cis-trans isomerase/CLD [Nonomuraea coxensis DSM 45129]|uniref:Cyclophilin type peptidyl-prolyl cis-trans isomerase/CLD n=1 Tax=Nonomuraea coxensis DSM 45129 TaxID=1122611 RepID=A0ABX8U609_9ACTN|nr:peptidylprolyl isomerase [Nonomuraea coxensis]QYC43083.1 Cyclophilin type peptidyl-prolyl cis-trans isomerase/CLD [Nonomuraea coxensis DSM 45129]